MKKNYTSKNVKETNLLAKEFAIKIKNKKSIVIGLRGELGSGKTTFIKAFLKELGIKGKIISPTFVIMKNFKQKKESGTKNIYHIDAYRIDSKKDLEETGIKEALEDKNGFLIIEWADKIKDILPKNTIWIDFKYKDKKNERNININ